MKLLRLASWLCALGLAPSLRAEAVAPARPDTTAKPAAAPATPATIPVDPIIPATAADDARFTTFTGASPFVISTVGEAQTIAGVIRSTIGTASTEPILARAVGQASAAIAQDGRVARIDILAERQAALTRLRLAQGEQERQRLITDLRAQSGQRMDEQRELARQVRDRLRELRDSTQITPRPNGGN